MEFRTKIEFAKTDIKIDYQTKLMIVGSCFSENIGERLRVNRFDTDINPFGVLYNPASISQALTTLLDKKRFEQFNLFEYEGCFHSYQHHSSFSSIDRDACLSKINTRIEHSSNKLNTANILLVTLGSSYVFELKKSGQVVANCHKQPSSQFNRYRLSVAEIVADWSKLIERLLATNQDLKIIFTVSPIRHWKDGAHGNQISKSILLLAIDELQNRYANISYFPAYELVLDELRDYRFFEEDMLHPTKIAINFIWEYFEKQYFGEPIREAIREWQSIDKALNHRPFNAETSEHKLFIRQTDERLRKFNDKWFS